MKSTQSVVSQAASIAQSTVSLSRSLWCKLNYDELYQASQVETKLRSNQTKAKLRTLLRNIDAGKFYHQAFGKAEAKNDRCMFQKRVEM